MLQIYFSQKHFLEHFRESLDEFFLNLYMTFLFLEMPDVSNSPNKYSNKLYNVYNV